MKFHCKCYLFSVLGIRILDLCPEEWPRSGVSKLSEGPHSNCFRLCDVQSPLRLQPCHWGASAPWQRVKKGVWPWGLAPGLYRLLTPNRDEQDFWGRLVWYPLSSPGEQMRCTVTVSVCWETELVSQPRKTAAPPGVVKCCLIGLWWSECIFPWEEVVMTRGSEKFEVESPRQTNFWYLTILQTYYTWNSNNSLCIFMG